ncbi:hypothetical protein [Clostridium tertium]|uniref:hypothetical protein n=2 Tax=Clostridium tertium TaxID=1559 RepID=UPI000C07D91B|nr:hypothetical protein [Clostridium tertium]MDB1940402.1 hypothetical protein [Clostridium tertium]
MRKSTKKIICFFVGILVILGVFSRNVFANSMEKYKGSIVADSINSKIPEEVREENTPNLDLMYMIYIKNRDGGSIYQEFPDGSKRSIGNVIRSGKYPTNSSAGFWASHYDAANDGTHSCITASASNNVHVRVGPNESYDPIKAAEITKASVPSLSPADIEAAGVWMPKQFTIGTEDDYVYAEINNPSKFTESIIYTDILGGNEIFGGESGAFVGNPVQFLDNDEEWKSLDYYYNGSYDKPIPEDLRIVVSKPSISIGSPVSIEFENWAAGDTVNGEYKESNGRVLLNYADGTSKHIADIIQRVRGTGRFGGSEYSHVGTFRASHPGVICLSTSPKVGRSNWGTYIDYSGGIQLVPANHAKFLAYNVDQKSFIDGAYSQQPHYGIIASIGSNKEDLYNPEYAPNGEITFDPILEAVAPLYSQYLKPKYIDGDIENSTMFVISEDFGVNWKETPTIMGLTGFENHSASFEESPVASWTNIKILLEY